MRKKLSTTVYLNPEQYEALKRMTLHTQIPMAQLIRNALSDYLERAQAEGKIPHAPVENFPNQRGVEPTGELDSAIERVLRRMLPRPEGGEMPSGPHPMAAFATIKQVK